MRRTVVAMTPMMDSAASRSVRLPTSAWPGRGVGDDGSNGPFDELQDHLTNDPSIATADAGRCFRLIDRVQRRGAPGTAFWRSIEGWVTSRWSAASGR